MNDSTHNILIIDDSAEDRESVKHYLSERSDPAYVVYEAENGEQGLEQCRLHAIDCILLDYHLPDVNGVDFLSRLHQQFGSAVPAVVMLTGQGNESLAVQAIKAGAQDYLVKGVSLHRVGQALPAAIESTRLRRVVDAQRREVMQLSEERAALVAKLEERTEQLVDADRRKDEFLATLAHELRNPLAPIRTSMHVLKLMYPNEHKADDIRNVVERQVSHLAHLIDDLMDVARINSGKVVLQRAPVELNALVEHVVEVCSPQLSFGKHTIKVDVPPPGTMLYADPVRLVQVLTNILSNACKYTLEPGVIKFSASVEGKNAIFSIRDPGIGMAKESLSSIFERFTQVKPAQGLMNEGLGLGLSLARQFVEMHGGTIEPRSEGIRKGSEFVITLPVVTEAPHTTQPAPKLPQSGLSNDQRKVLLIDDNRDGADMLKMIFEAEGFDVETAYNGEDAVRAAGSRHPDILVMDLGMPGIDGYEAIRQIRQQAAGAPVLAIALTGWNQGDTAQHTRDAGFDHHMVKPVEYHQLKNIIDESLGVPH